jgi:hypothetical protein
MRKTLITTLALGSAFGLGSALLAPSAAVAVPPTTIVSYTYTTTATSADFTLPATVAGLRFELNQFGEFCAVFDITVHGSFQYWTGSEFATYTQEGAPQRIANCQGADAFRQALTAFYLDCAAGNFDLSRFTSNAGTLYFRGSDGGLLIGSASLAPLVLTAATAEQREAICDLDARLPRGPDWRLVNAVNNVLGTFVTT